MPVPFSIDIAGPMLSGMHLGLQKQGQDQSLMLNAERMQQAQMRLEEQMRAHDQIDEYRQRLLDIKSQADQARLDAGDFPDEAATALGLIPHDDGMMGFVPTLNGQAGQFGLTEPGRGPLYDTGPQEIAQTQEGQSIFGQESQQPQTPQQQALMSREAWRGLSPKARSALGTHAAQQRMTGMYKDQQTQQARADYESKLKAAGLDETDVAAAMQDYDRKQAKLPVTSEAQRFNMGLAGDRFAETQRHNQATEQNARERQVSMAERQEKHDQAMWEYRAAKAEELRGNKSIQNMQRQLQAAKALGEAHGYVIGDMWVPPDQADAEGMAMFQTDRKRFEDAAKALMAGTAAPAAAAPVAPGAAPMMQQPPGPVVPGMTVRQLQTVRPEGAAPGAPAKVMNKQQYDALPPGATYIAPDGSTRRKP